jgi:cytochrome c biogenesis protein CcmG/thiol:disulfide interchange protein DsbE
MKKLLIFLAVMIPAVSLLYFGLTRDPRTLPSALIGKPAPRFNLTSLDGEKVSSEQTLGRPMVLNFWSTWCGSCAAEHGLIQEAVRAYAKSDLLFYAVLYEDTEENARKFIAEYGAAAPILLDPNLKTAIDYGVSGVPETFFIDRQGKILYKQAGVLTPDLLMEKISLLMQSGKGQ